jgi:hypothetical protein
MFYDLIFQIILKYLLLNCVTFVVLLGFEL